MYPAISKTNETRFAAVCDFENYHTADLVESVIIAKKGNYFGVVNHRFLRFVPPPMHDQLAKTEPAKLKKPIIW